MLRPLGNRVVVKIIPVAAEEHRPGVLRMYTEPTEAVVIAVGKGALQEAKEDDKDSTKLSMIFIPPDVEMGDTVLLGQHNGVLFKVGGEEFLVIQEEDILGVF